eukprot:492680_1
MTPPPSLWRGPIWIIPQIIVGSIEFIVCFCCLLYSCYVYTTYHTRSSYHKHKQTMSLPKFLKIFNLLGITSFMLCSITQVFDAYYYNKIYWKYTAANTLFWYSTWFLWSCGQCVSYSLFLNRIKKTFESSVYKPTKLTIYSLHILIIMYGLSWTIANLLPFILYTPYVDNTISRSKIFEFQFYFSISVTVIDICITFSMTYIFVSRLYQLILLQTTNAYNENNNSELSYSSSSSLSSSLLSNKNIKMITISVKITVLSVTSLLSSVILIVFRAISYFMSYNTPLDKCMAFWLHIDCIISCICLLLFLPRTQKAFGIFCCCCNNILSKYMKQSVRTSTIALSKNKTAKSVTTSSWVPQASNF